MDRLIDFILLIFTIFQAHNCYFIPFTLKIRRGKFVKVNFLLLLILGEGGILVGFFDTFKLVKLVYLWSLSFVWSQLLDM